jgi:hypothetical protein
MQSPNKINPVHTERRALVEETTDEVQSEASEIAELLKKTALRVQCLGAGLDIVNEVAARYLSTIASFRQAVDAKNQAVDVMKEGFRALQKCCAAFGMDEDVFAKALYDSTRREMTAPCTGLSFGQTEGYRYMRAKGAEELEGWFVAHRDNNFGVRLEAKKYRRHDRPQAPSTILFTMAESVPGSPQFRQAAQAAMRAYKQQISAAFVADRLHAPTPQQLQTLAVGHLVQEWVDPNTAFGA